MIVFNASPETDNHTGYKAYHENKYHPESDHCTTLEYLNTQSAPITPFASGVVEP